jgi:hypothetical protein
MALASRDFNFMSPTSYFLSNGKENARKIFFFSPDEKKPGFILIGREKKSFLVFSFTFERK